ncbi:MAG: RNase H-like domain-containing protein, partial [Gammaproteobacteria bacterium]|nr:RNase H-like domain-containing protein [Gammaproteobacteria bacterium]
MELDTGAAVTLVSESTYRRLWPYRPLQECPMKLRTYSGEQLTVLGQLHVQVQSGVQSANLPLVVVQGDGSSLLGRDWLLHLRLDWKEIHHLQTTDPVERILLKHEEVFRKGLGTLRGYKAKIYVDKQATPRFCKARSVPYSLRVKVEEELDRLVQEGILEPVQFSEWAAPIVPVIKPDKSVRICGDFKLTVNQASKLDRYPIPRIDDLFATLAGGESFTKLDMSQAFQQILLDEESKSYVVINTHKGLFRYNRLPFGVSSAPGIFQRVMEGLLSGIPGVVVYIDDILVTGKTTADHLAALDEVLTRLEKAGLHLKRKKCFLMQPSVTYLGHLIDAQGLHPLPDKVRAVQEAPPPRSVAQLKSYLGLLTYYSKFLPNLSSTLSPLYRLLRQSTCWCWTPKEQEAFEASKQLLTSAPLLVHFNPELEITLSCDASPYGLGAVLSHRMPDGTEKPVGYASRTLTQTEQKYSQIEKEGLACVFGVKKFHSYVYGYRFSLVTDHKPLLSLFNESHAVPPQASGRIQRWALTLAAYEYTLSFRSSAQHRNADALSRLPLSDMPEETPLPAELVQLVEHLEDSPVSSLQIKVW